MKKTFDYVLAFAIIIAFAACGKSSDGKIHVENTLSEWGSDSLSESLEQFINIAEGDYALTKETIGYSLNLKLENQTGDFDDEDNAKAAVLANCQMVISLLDKDGTELSGGELALASASLKDVIDWCNSSDLHSLKEFKFLLPLGSEELVSKAAGIKIFAKSYNTSSATYTPASGDEEIEEANEEETEETASSDVDFDDYLDSYEEYMDQYISLLQRASDGDMTAMSEYPAIMQKAKEMGDKMEKLSGDLTPAQLARFQKLQMKFLKAAQEMKN